MLAKRRIPYSVYPSTTTGVYFTLPISTDHKWPGAPSFAILRRVGSKALNQPKRRCFCCCLFFLKVKRLICLCFLLLHFFTPGLTAYTTGTAPNTSRCPS